MPTLFRDYYEVLSIPRTATPEEIKQAYRKLARQHHPDLHPAEEKDIHTKRMQEVNEAYAVLSSRDDRTKYDLLGQHWKDGPPPAPPAREPDYQPDSGGGNVDPEAFSDFFRTMFNQRRGRETSDDLSASELDIEASLDLSLDEAVHGVEKSFSLITTGVCPSCRGTGRTNESLCPICGGVGEIRRPRDIKTRIPAGLENGNRIRLKGQGNTGTQGRRGDLYLEIRLRVDSRFRLDGRHLETDVRVMPWQAALGGEISVPTLDGSVRVRIPKGTHTGKRLRLAGKGLGKPAARGDLFIRLTIDIPDTISSKAETLMKQLEDESDV